VRFHRPEENSHEYCNAWGLAQQRPTPYPKRPLYWSTIHFLCPPARNGSRYNNRAPLSANSAKKKGVGWDCGTVGLWTNALPVGLTASLNSGLTASLDSGKLFSGCALVPDFAVLLVPPPSFDLTLRGRLKYVYCILD
jgi:hypothetical protein